MAEMMDFAPTLLPDEGDIDIENVVTSYPSYTYKLDLEKGRIRGYVDDIEAIKQAVYKLLDTVAGAHAIYSPSYGLFLLDLIGSDHDLAKSEIRRRIKENALLDGRIEEVDSFSFQSDGDQLSVSFRMISTSGETVEIERRLDGLS